MEIKYQEVKLFLYDKLVEASSYFGIFPEVEGGLVPQNPKNLRLRVYFRNFKMNPATDFETILSGDVIAEILYEPGEFETADYLIDRILSVYTPGQGELQNRNYRILTSSATTLENRNEGKYQRTGISLQVTVWENHEH